MDRHDRPDDSSKNRHAPGSMNEEVSGAGQRFKGAVKRETGDASSTATSSWRRPSSMPTGRRLLLLARF